MVAVPLHRAFHDLAVYTVIGGQVVFCRPLFEIEQIAKKLIDRVLFKQPQFE